jgi:hypothetical protein
MSHIGTVTSIVRELDVHDLGFKPSLIRTPTTITPLLHWLSTTHNAIDLAEKTFLQVHPEHKQLRD